MLNFRLPLQVSVVLVSYFAVATSKQEGSVVSEVYLLSSVKGDSVARLRRPGTSPDAIQVLRTAHLDVYPDMFVIALPAELRLDSRVKLVKLQSADSASPLRLTYEQKRAEGLARTKCVTEGIVFELRASSDGTALVPNSTARTSCVNQSHDIR